MYLLHTYPDRFVVEVDSGLAAAAALRLAHADGGVPAPVEPLQLDRASGGVARLKAGSKPPQGAAYSERIDGILGIITLLRGKYLIVMTGSKHVATVQGCPIRQLVDCKILPFASSGSGDKHSTQSGASLTKQQAADEARYLALLHHMLKCAFFYFSYDYDLTLHTQRIAGVRTDPSLNAQPLWRRADERFWWNRFLQRDLIDASADEFILPLMNGYVFQQHQRIQHTDVTFVLISRRSHQRTGRRFVTRGLDAEGHAANFAETEQTLYLTDPLDPNSTRVASFVQTRGSIPVLWEQPVTLKYTPKIAFQVGGRAVSLASDESARRAFESATADACRKHFEAQTQLYGKQVCLNLVNQKGAELALVKAFKAQVDALNRPDVRLVSWDFHHECRKMKYENIGKLATIVNDDVEQMGWFCARVSSSGGAGGGAARRVEWEITRRQSGVLRTNCIDCLDRTNVVQSVFARRVLDRQLAELTGFRAGVDRHESLDVMFRHVWANNADAMSLQYSGTGALKTDYTRTGKRTLRGACADGVNSLTRYYLNNFRDGRNQDAVDLFLGVFRPSLTAPSPFAAARSRAHPAHQKSLLTFAWTYLLALALLLATFTALAPASLTPHRSWSLTTQATVFGAVAGVSGLKLLQRYGKDYANKPIFRHAAHADKHH